MIMRQKSLASLLFVLCGTAAIGQTGTTLKGASFVPDGRVTDPSAGMHTSGSATWTAANGELVGKGGNNGGWLISDKSYQDVGVYTAFRCETACDAGVLVRMTKTADGMKGSFLALKGAKMEPGTVVIDASGKMTQQTADPSVGPMQRFVPPPSPTAARPFGVAAAIGPQPIKKPAPGIWPGQWNEVETLIDADILRGFLNEGGDSFNAAAGNMDDYGSFALYVGPNAEVHFKNVAYKDLAFKKMPAESVGQGFRKQELSPFYYNWSADVADFNHDGKPDVLSGAYVYFGPDYTTRQEITPAVTANPSNEYMILVQHAFDYTGDGWPDVLSTNIGSGAGGGAFLTVNPAGESRRWKTFHVIPSLSSEETITADLDGDGKPELIYIADGFMSYAKPDASDATKPWIQHHVSEKGSWPAHGIGVGDIDGDGKPDIVGSYGWWEQPKSGLGSDAPWKYHEEAFGRAGRINVGGTKIGVYDVNGDGLADVVTALEAHSWGLAWFEQKRSPSGEISFVEHMVMDNLNSKNSGDVAFTELHGADIADIDGDGIPDYIVGKRVYSHQDDFYDPDPYSGAFLYWYQTVRDPKAPGGARLVPHLIHNWSGAGSDMRVVDLNGDGRPDVITSTKLGTFIFWNEMGKGMKKR